MKEDQAPGAKSVRVAVVLGFGQNFWQDQRVQRTGRALAAAGYEVLAYTPVESRDSERPIDNVSVRYVRTPLGNLGILRKVFVSHLLYCIPAAFDILRRRAKICHCNDFDTLPCGALVKAMSLGRTKVVYDSHEDYPSFVGWGHGRLLARIIAVAEAMSLRAFVDMAIGVNEALTSRLKRQGPRAETVFNCQELPGDDAAAATRVVGEKGKEFWVAYQGNITAIRGYERLVEAADILVNKRGIVAVRFLVIGRSTPDPAYGEHIRQMVQARGLDGHFQFTGHIGYDDMMQVLRLCDAGLILFQPTPNNMGGLPNKLFENLAAGIPTIASNFPHMGRLLAEEQCGLLVDPTKPEELADAIDYLCSHRDEAAEMGRNALRAAKDKYNFAKQAEKLLDVYTSLT